MAATLDGNSIEFSEGAVVKVVNQIVEHDGTAALGEDSVAPTSIPGYTPIGIAGWHELTSIEVFLFKCCIHNGNIEISWRTRTGQNVANNRISIYVLYVKS